MEHAMNNQNEQLIINDSGVMPVRISGAIIALWMSATLYFSASLDSTWKILDWVFLISGPVMLLFFANLRIIANRATRTLRLEYRYLLFRRSRTIPFDNIESVFTEKGRYIRGGHSKMQYRIAAKLRDGKRVPFRLSFSGEHEIVHQEKQLQDFIKGNLSV